jgi:flagellar motility protein MotE (MotC chaperone)
MCALIELTKDPSYLLRFKAGESPVVDELAAATEQVIARTLGKMTPGAAAEVLAMMAAQG